MTRTVHIIGAGLAGLAAAVKLAPSGAPVVVHEATAYPGGRCRSYLDRTIGMTIDNGNHLVLSGNHAVLGFVTAIGSAASLVGPPKAEFAFVDLASNERWTLRMNDGLPWWVFDKSRRVPGTRLGEYLRLSRLLWASGDAPVGEVIDCSGPLYERLVHPLLLAALNIEPRQGSAALASAIVRETLAQGGQACRPLIARDGLGPAFIEPALAFLKRFNTQVRLDHELHAIRFADGRIAELDFGADAVTLGADDMVILAVPHHAAAALVPDLPVPQGHRAIANAHFRIAPPPGLPPILGLINATTEWIFAFDGRLSVTISNADRLMDVPRAMLAQSIWQEVSRATGIVAELPAWQIVRERRATFAATPEENAKRPAAQTQWSNLVVAGDWTATGLPATLESAVRSGNRAADCVTAKAAPMASPGGRG
ncbi:MAG: hydroxysqualene dehydroxylase HpnE [Hyphomicrobiales bacterium]|nr:hydroxysqualene dehydroxylase HpnE [Alphaproteobacteria bacterium]